MLLQSIDLDWKKIKYNICLILSLLWLYSLTSYIKSNYSIIFNLHYYNYKRNTEKISTKKNEILIVHEFLTKNLALFFTSNKLLLWDLA